MAIDRLIKSLEVQSAMGCGATRLYGDIKNELMPPPLKRGRSSYWVESEIAAISAARIGGADDNAVRQLVRQLLAARTAQASAGEALQSTALHTKNFCVAIDAGTLPSNV